MEIMKGLEFIKIPYLFKMISKLKQISKNVFIATLDSLSPNYSCKLNNLRQRLMNRNFFLLLFNKKTLLCLR